MIRLKIKETAIKKGITSSYQLQQHIGGHPSFAARLWKEEMTAIRLETIEKLCRALKVKPSALFEISDE